jgi:hypothetical protein
MLSLRVQGKIDAHKTYQLLKTQKGLWPLFFVTGAYWFRFFGFIVQQSQLETGDVQEGMSSIAFKKYWAIAWCCLGGILYGLLFDNLSNFSNLAI